MTKLPPDFREVREKAHKLLADINLYFYETKTPLNEIIFVPSALLGRIIGTHDSLGTLLSHDFVVDAAIITLAQFELRLQLAWTACDIKNASAWVSHPDLFNSPIKITKKIKEFFKAPSEESNRLLCIFTHLSGVKHANPVMSELVFGGRSTATGGITFSTGIIGDAFTSHFSELLMSFSTYQLAWCCHVGSIYVAKYARVDHELTERLRHIGLEYAKAEEEICSFMQEVTTRQGGFFGLAAKKERGPR